MKNNKKKKYLLISATITLLVFLIVLSVWINDNSKFTISENITPDDFIIASSMEDSEGNLLHKLRYGNSQTYSDNIISINENGIVKRLVTLKNGRIDKAWKNDESINIIYRKGQTVYNNEASGINILTYNYSENKIISDKDLSKRIWGIDPNEIIPLYDNQDIKFKRGLRSNIVRESFSAPPAGGLTRIYLRY